MDLAATWFEYLHSDNADSPEMPLYASIPADQDEVVPLLLDGIDRASGWVLHRSKLSRAVMQIRFEVQGRNLMDMYAALVGIGLEFSRDSQLLLNERCTCVQHNAETRRAIQALRLELVFDEPLRTPPDWGRLAANA